MSWLSRIIGSGARISAPGQTTIFKRSVEGGEVGAFGGFSGGIGPQYYEALRSSEARSRIFTAQFLAGSDLSRRELALLARALYDNGGHAALAVDQIADYSVPVAVKAASPDRDWNTAADAIFAEFFSRADFYGRPEVDLNGLQRLSCIAMDLDGDVLPIMTKAAGFPQIQLLDGHRISNPDKSGSKIESGVEFDAYGRTVAYHVEVSDGKWERIPAASAYLLRDLSPVAPRRGITPMRRGLNDLRDARDILGYEKSAVKVNSAMPMWIKGTGSAEAKKEFAIGTDDDLAAPAEELPPKIARIDLTGNDVLTFEDGRELVPVEPNRPNATFDSFLDILIGGFAAGLGIPPSFFLDAKMTGPGWRAVIGKAQRKFNSRQAAFEGFMRWVWVRVIADAIESKKLKTTEGWTRVTAQRPARLSIDIGDEATADINAVNARLMSRLDYWGKRQKDWEDEVTQEFAETERIIQGAQELAKKTGVSIDVIFELYGIKKPAAKPRDGEKEK